MIRACACGAKLFAALEYEQPGRLRPAGSPLQFSANKKKPPERRLFLLVEMIRLELTTYTLRTYRSTG